MMENLKLAYENMKQGKIEELAEVVAQLKALPRTEDGIWDLSSIGDMYEVARFAYPVYCAYETTCNKKEGYPDLLAQLRVWNTQTTVESGVEKYAALLDMQMNVLEVISPEIYEYYRELLDMFRADVKQAIASFYRDGAFAVDAKVDALVKGAIKRACDADLLLAEKYECYTM
ncbi:MAG: hypothetical protein IJN16_01460 [Lachnospiraceae bacterium]|nr:hypothetical protein [Lachnospiraceae bacterium]